MAIITVSREYGSNGEAIAKMVAKRLGYDYFDKELLLDVVRTAQVKEKDIRKYDEKDEPGFHRLLKKLFLPDPKFAHYPYYPGLDWAPTVYMSQKAGETPVGRVRRTCVRFFKMWLKSCGAGETPSSLGVVA